MVKSKVAVFESNAEGSPIELLMKQVAFLMSAINQIKTRIVEEEHFKINEA